MRVTVDMYSGRPNPTWIVSRDVVEQIRLGLLNIHAQLTPRTGPVRLGYRSVVVATTAQERRLLGLTPETLLLGDMRGRITAQEAALVKQLLLTAGTALSAAEFAHVTEQLETAQAQRPRSSPQATDTAIEELPAAPEVVSILPYDPNYWNNNQQRKQCNNCYNYGCNYVSNTFAQPGYASGQPITSSSCNAVRTGSVYDGLLLNVPQGTYYKVALVTMANNTGLWDFHWYRLVQLPNNTNCWGHKPGSTNVTNLDDNNTVIVNPQTCARAMYPVWCGYMYVPVPTAVEGPGCPPGQGAQ